MANIVYRSLNNGDCDDSASFKHYETQLIKTRSKVLSIIYPKTTKIRLVYICLMLLITTILYATWCFIVNCELDDSIDEGHNDKSESDSPLMICEENFQDTRLFIQDRKRQEWENLTIIYFITPTYPRREQFPELTRLGYTLQHVPRIHWIVADDYKTCNSFLTLFLYKFRIPFTHLASPMPHRFYKLSHKPRGVSNRRASLQWLRNHNISNGILYFGDDDNTYDIELFNEIRETKRVSMFPVGLIGDMAVSGPVVREGKVVGFLDSWVGERRWPVDMAGFAVNLAYLIEHPNASMPYIPGYEEDYFLRSIGLHLNIIEPRGKNCTELLVWHTQTIKHFRATVILNHRYLDERSNIGALFKTLTKMGVAISSDNKGVKATISKNGKSKPLEYFLS